MTNATLDRVLAVLIVAMVTTGLLTLRAGAPETAWLFTAHAILAGSLLAATALKLRGSIPRAIRAARWRRLAIGLLVSILTIAAISGGLLWVASGELISLGSWTVLTLHAWVGLVLGPLVVVHLLPHRWRLLRPRRLRSTSGALLSRRFVLVGAALALGGVGTFSATRLIERARGGERRFTGSRWLPAGGIPPATTFLGEGTPVIDPDGWRMTVAAGDGAKREWSLADLRSLGEVDLTAVLDCTSGWVLETAWRGVPLRALLGGIASTTGMRVASVTGWVTFLTPDEVDSAFLATGVAGADLPAANGAPCRLVVPDRRGVDWVKWVTDVRPA